MLCAHLWKTAVAALLTAGTLMLALPVRAADEDGAALLAKHKTFVGWELGDPALDKLRVDGTIERTRKDGKVVTDSTYVDRRIGILNRRSAADAYGLSQESGFTGKLYWYSDENGFTVPRLGDERKSTLARAVLFDEATTSLSAVVLRHETVDGVPLVVLREKLPIGIALDLYVDPATGAYRRAVVDPEGDAETSDIDAYADIVPGKKAISAWHYAKSDYRHRENVTVDATLTPGDLHPPAPHASWTFGNGSAVPIEVTEHRIYVDAMIDGVKGRFILDTGADDIVVTNSFARRAKLHAIRSMEFSGLTGTGRGRVLEAGALSFPDGSRLEHVILSDGLADLDETDEKVDGLLGYDFLAGALVDVDLDTSKMRLYDATNSKPSESAGAVVVPDLATGQPRIPAKLDGTHSVVATLDTGNWSYVLIPDDLVGHIRVLLDDSNLGSYRGFGGADGGYEVVRCGKLDSIAIGPVLYQSPPFCFTRGIASPDALIGFDFFKHFNYTFDYPDGKIVMVPRRKS